MEINDPNPIEIEQSRTAVKPQGPLDVIVVGGGVNGVGIARDCALRGYRVALVEKNDFAWGTSSRSSKLVHGGLRYLRDFQIGLTRASVRERERLLEEGPGLIDPMGFLLATYKGDRPPGWVFEAGLTVYDLLALRWSHQQYNAHDFQLLAPHITTQGLQGGFRYGDAQTDDARLVLRVIREAVRAGGVALNYAGVEALLCDGDSCVNGACIVDTTDNGRQSEVRARAVINATGAWADHLRGQVGGEPRIRPLRGSHLIFPAWRFPVAQSISFLHPRDQRPVFIFPWEGGVVAIDWERAKFADPASDLGRMMAEISHSIKQHGGSAVEAQPFVFSLAQAYCQALSGDWDKNALLDRARFYQALSTARIARNGWVSRLDRTALVAQAMALLSGK